MFRHQKIQILEDFFKHLSERRSRKDIYFYRIYGYSQEVEQFIRKYYEAARSRGVVIEGKIPNPDEKNLAYYSEMMGMDFQLSLGFIGDSLGKWLPRMKPEQRRYVAESMYDCLFSLQKEGKNDHMLRNAYIKFMCWLYYKFERIVNFLGENEVPKILYEGEISRYELMLISILANAGCDVVLLQYRGDQKYLALDPGSILSDPLTDACDETVKQTGIQKLKEFPQGFSLGQLREEMRQEQNTQRLYGRRPEILNCTNAWISGKGLEDIRIPVLDRGTDPKLFYNCFLTIHGVEDKLTYLNELYQFSQELKASKRPLVIVNGAIPQPSAEEISGIRRQNYKQVDQMLMDLSTNIRCGSEPQLERLMVKAFIDVMREEAKDQLMNINKLTGRAVYLLCWLKRYQYPLFLNWKIPQISIFIQMGGCCNETECLFVKLLSKLPVDVLILDPDKNREYALKDPMLYELNFAESLRVSVFPEENTNVQMGTAAYHAERELDTILYQNSGLYRDKQHQKAMSVSLQTMYEEIWLLWKEDLKYRPNFSVNEDKVNMPVLFAKISGVKDGSVSHYWEKIRELVTEDTIVIRSVPYIDPLAENAMKAPAVSFYKNQRLQREKIKQHPDYPYGFLRAEVQEHILDKLQLLIDERLIRGTFENGTEYTIIATVLNLPKEILRLIQKFDFTKKNPKVIYINTGEKTISLEDSILMTFLNLVGFDIVFFVPTGYQNIEKYFNKKVMEEHQAGEYIYDLPIPELEGYIPSVKPKTWVERLFRGGI